MTEPFWIIWNPAGHRPPSYRHTTEESAVVEARRLAVANPGDEFFALRVIGHAVAPAPRAVFTRIAGGEPPRVLKHGEYLPGDRVRYTGRGPHARLSDLQVGMTGVVTSVESKEVWLNFDTHAARWRVSFPSLEHESLPQFEVGDRVRVKGAGLKNVRRAAGHFGTITDCIDGPNAFEITFDDPVPSDHGNDSREWYAQASEIELVRPVQAGGGS